MKLCTDCDFFLFVKSILQKINGAKRTGFIRRTEGLVGGGVINRVRDRKMASFGMRWSAGMTGHFVLQESWLEDGLEWLKLFCQFPELQV